MRGVQKYPHKMVYYWHFEAGALLRLVSLRETFGY
jgi:hypothetical protein